MNDTLTRVITSFSPFSNSLKEKYIIQGMKSSYTVNFDSVHTAFHHCDVDRSQSTAKQAQPWLSLIVVFIWRFEHSE